MWVSRFPRLLVAVTGATLAAVAVTGCSTGDGSDSASAASSAAGTRTITDASGAEVQVPAAPSRVVALSEPTLDGALALGVTPVGTTNGRGQGSVPAYLGDRAGDIPVVATIGSPDLEKIAALQPDLILVDGTTSSDESVIGKLRGIAPTVFVSVSGQDWKTAFTAQADALGRAAQGEKVLSDYEARVEQIKGALGPNAGATVSIVRWSGQPQVLMKELLPGKVVADLGLARPASQNMEGPGHSVPISLENLQEIDADWVFFGTLGGGGAGPGGGASQTGTGAEASAKALVQAGQSPGFTSLKAYTAHRIVPVDGSAWMSAGGPLAATTILDTVQQTLAAGA
ncbi:ABC transporter substrate-binding protein [Motilibacter deserti]|uniref:Iron-siderophore ABC transporter substrate-binding protein n=1 Tax=Motilibacter deserti TaxID=2714956 RepID=A0ABX0GWW5_9ACTN|nr:iron-siderophore ABC transporter substrate-binding protein [Motilibacter deserti]NHC14114.1 iron-siderophore ABC transporter substrate-binding protein [Motilibacter deserti]